MWRKGRTIPGISFENRFALETAAGDLRQFFVFGCNAENVLWHFWLNSSIMFVCDIIMHCNVSEYSIDRGCDIFDRFACTFHGF